MTKMNSMLTGKQVITVTPFGGIEGLQRKKGEGIDLRAFGKADIKRASEIRWCGARQKWFVELLQAPYEGRAIDLPLLSEVNLKADLYPGITVSNDKEQFLLFDEYETAVVYEVRTLDELRRQGKLN